MGFIWNDKTFWKRYKEGSKIEFKILYPLWIISFLIWFYLFKNEIEWKYLSGLALLSGLSIFTFIDIFKQYPHPNIPDTYSSFSKTFMYIGHFLITFIGFLYLYFEIFP